MDMGIIWIGVASIIGASVAVAIGGVGPALAEGMATKQTLASMAQQPDEANTLRSTLFVSMAMLESTAIYALLVSMVLIFSNPFWNYAIENAPKQVVKTVNNVSSTQVPNPVSEEAVVNN